MAENQANNQLDRDYAERLDQFERAWLEGSVPDVAEHLRGCSDAGTRYLRTLTELDLEYRWKRFRWADELPAQDDHGFPTFPQLEDYAALMPADRRGELLVPDMVAEEYRVRTRWGDRPDKQSYVERFPHQSDTIESALEGVHAEFAPEGAAFFTEGRRDSLADQSTATFLDDGTEADSSTVVSAPRELGKYRLESLLGSGGYGEVWKAFDPTLKRHVAVKVPRRDKRFRQDQLSNFNREAEKLASLRRVRGIVTVFDYGEFDGQPYIVSDYIEGESLRDRLKRGVVPYREAAELIAEVAAAINRAHLKNLVHRDIKPSNILLDQEGGCYLADFGLCATEEEQLREGHSTIGTCAYMSPEQARGESHRTDGRADIYALGVVLYRMLTGRLPFVADTVPEYVDQLLHREPRPLRSIDPDIPAELERICLKCLSKTISDRYTTAADLAADLRAWNAPPRTTRSVFRFAALGGALLLLLVLPPVISRLRLPDSTDTIEHVARPFRWFPLLARQPQPLFPVDDEVSRWDYDEQAGEVSMQSPTLGWLMLGRTDLNSFRLRVDVTKVAHQGASGLVFGLHPQQWEDGSTGWSGQMIWLDCGRGDRYQLQRVHVDLKPMPDRDSFMPYNKFTLATIDVPPSQIQGARLEITVESGSLSQCRWEGLLLANLCNLNAPVPHGKVGLVNSFGAVTFQNAEFMPLRGE